MNIGIYPIYPQMMHEKYMNLEPWFFCIFDIFIGLSVDIAFSLFACPTLHIHIITSRCNSSFEAILIEQYLS